MRRGNKVPVPAPSCACGRVGREPGTPVPGTQRPGAQAPGTRSCPRAGMAGAIRSTLWRMRRSPLIALHLVLAVALGGAAGLYFGATPWDAQLSCDAFMQLVGAGAPLLVGLSCGLAIDAEREAGAYANLLGAVSRRRVLAALGLVLLALGVLAAVLATGVFAALMGAFGRSLPAPAAFAQALLGIAAGSACLYALAIAIALKWGRNAAIAVGALGFMGALMSIGGLANGLVTGTFSGAMAGGVTAWIPIVWPVRLASLAMEAAISAASARPELAAQLPALQAAAREVLVACAAVTVPVVAGALAAANRFEDARRGGE